jgi:hypothetical protein
LGGGNVVMYVASVKVSGLLKNNKIEMHHPE